MSEKDLKKGTTTVGIVCKDGVVVGTEYRATMGYLIAHKKTKKLFKIDEHMAMTVAGLVGDAQTLVRWIKAEAELYRLKTDKGMSLKAASTLMSNILNARKFFPFWVQLVLAGVDEEGNHVYSIDAAGGAIPDDYVTTGSGSPYVYGVLEDYYKPDITTKEGVEIALRGLAAAIKRDAASGNGIELAVIDKKGFLYWEEKKVKEKLEELKISLN
ncbi:MAG TPA: archaeal proteasome endopeptidase complex subunit beta [Thermoplasmata archaeon]|nr:archaeal proteasome endopeptidase complex subunit beta [Thermoplasmata archaeon]